MRAANVVLFLVQPDLQSYMQSYRRGVQFGQKMRTVRNIECQVVGGQTITGRTQFEDGSVEQWTYSGPYYIGWAEEPLQEE